MCARLSSFDQRRTDFLKRAAGEDAMARTRKGRTGNGKERNGGEGTRSSERRMQKENGKKRRTKGRAAQDTQAK
jgi:hypothetical protein